MSNLNLGLSYGLPQPQENGLWRPEMETSSCGIGFVADLKGEKSHRIVAKGLEAVGCLTHRGAVAADSKTGDGAGLLTQIPHKLLRATLGKGQGKLIKRDEDMAVAMIFFPQDDAARHRAQQICEVVIEESDLIFLGWRRVPVDLPALGEIALKTCPEIRQMLLLRPEGLNDLAFERLCYVLRKRMEARVAAEKIEGFYIPSFSCKTIVYKGLILAPQLPRFYEDLQNPDFHSAIALYHQRYSTNTFPTWFLAQPFRFLAHNGEINTAQGNNNWIRARENAENGRIWGSKESLAELRPIIQPGGSDSAGLDNAFESVVASGRDILHTALMMVPDAYHSVADMPDDLRAFYEYHAAMQEPWDGPAALSFTDGDVIGACLDRNGLRPFRYQISDDNVLLVGSEVGTIDIGDAKLLEKGRLGPGQILALDLKTGQLMHNQEVKERYSKAAPYRDWVSQNLIQGDFSGKVEHIAMDAIAPAFGETLLAQQKAFGFTTEDVDDMISPMVKSGIEPTGSMGDDTPLAVLSEKPRLLYTYFRQRFAQVTNPPIDPLREKLVMSLHSFVGPLANLWEENSAKNCRRIEFPTPLLLNEQLAAIRSGETNWGAGFKSATVKSIWPVSDGENGLQKAVKKLQSDAARAVREGASILIISDRGVDAQTAAIPALMAVGAVHHHLIREGLRTRCSIIAESGEPRDSHHFACLIGYGAAAVNPYLALETAQAQSDPELVEKAVANFKKAVESGLLKVMSKMGISAVASYHGAQIFEALGVHPEVVKECFTGTPTRIRGSNFVEISRDVLRLHETAYPRETPATKLENFAYLRYRGGGELHAFTPSWFKPFHKAVREGDFENQFKIYSKTIDTREKPIVLRDLLEYKPLGAPIPIEEVEPIEAIFPRFCTAAMSLGSLSKEAHETMAIAMNRIGGKSNSGEGGEDPARFHRDANGDWRNSAIKQIASARFGVTPEYLASAKELQIKMAQGAKPGEGGQLPGFKVSAEIAFVRHSVPGVTLISPPPHHDIYSIEDLAQLIYDLKMVNPRCRVSVKLVSQAGVGTVAAGVAKAYADTIVIAGHDGGTGASPVGSIKNTGVSWELGLAETQQVLIQNGLRGRVRLHSDGGYKTGRDVIFAALLGAEEYGFGTAALMAVGCVMARQCHLNTCPVGVATQDQALRAKYVGTPENIVNFFTFIAQEIREHLAAMGARKLDEIIGRSDLLTKNEAVELPKTSDVDVSPLFFQFEEKDTSPRFSVVGKNDRPEDWPLDDTILQDVRDAISNGSHLTMSYGIKNTNRTVGGRIAGEIAYTFGDKGLPKGSITLHFDGTAGQSFGAFCIDGLNLYLTGEGLDYVGKSMHGGKIVVKPGDNCEFEWRENVVIGNTVLYGATGGYLFAAGQGGERFAVRNSGGTAVVEGIGDHGCEYMTGGTIVVLGQTGRNFGAGMSGGTAYILDEKLTFEKRYNPDMIGIERVQNTEDAEALKALITRHFEETASPQAQQILGNWEAKLPLFWKAVPHPEKAAAPVANKRAARVERNGVKPGEATAKVEDFAGREPVGQAIADVKEVPAPTPAGS
ncbi:glutamate synthase (NADPH/NADH) large chain/glutamate synthase (ferredoxin) [Abditibacterium utsteinense]|uniref:Glutamate synthase [NADPH] large chain n=1 Tax=Abditibacterium utsteinense TaxID=1960156 RepID=A0A2S8SXB0_9BACT|nr:glutamate synthase large subunit [Abditibacterium utsteinense]PQV65435.1 glutamate synthase (NADPH/NADH) large chain/glutamate synthase (ferredoxin) [Abditibacterium utsteinense]